MGSSRDSTAVLDRRGLARPGDGPSTRGPERSRDLHLPSPNRRKNFQRSLGSQQVVSVRGRRVSPARRTTLWAKLAAVAFGMLILGVALAMSLSGVSTQQAFQIQQMSSQERQLSNQLETLNRDLENVSSSAEIVRRAIDMGMAVPTQPGILEVRGDGEIVEERSADPATRPILDVNGQPIRPGQPSSDPAAIEELGDSLESLPQGRQLPPMNPAPGIAPYTPNVPAVPAASVSAMGEQGGENGQ